MAKNKDVSGIKKSKCYNCIHSSTQFKIDKLTHLHCFNNDIYKEEDLITGKISAWDTLRVFSDICDKHEFKKESEVDNG